MTLLARPPKEHDLDAEALIKEARHLRRRRWLIGLSVICLVAMVAGVVIAVATDKASTSLRSPSSVRTAPRPYTTSSFGVVPKFPEAMAIGQNGDLYVVDSNRDQILQRLPNGRFKVLAGNGKRGFSGDGGPAVDAELNLNQYGSSSGIAVARNGTVYISDSGNDRVRAILRDGDIETVAGGGTEALPAAASELVRARSASLGAPQGLTIGPNGELYIAANFIVRLTSTGQLAWVAGTNHQSPPVCSGRTCEVQEENFNGVATLAFDRDGDLVVTSGFLPGEGWGVAEIRTNGALVELGVCRGEGGKPGTVASGPNGSVICAAQTGLFRVSNGSKSMTLIPGTGQTSPLSAALGVPKDAPFMGGDGITVGSNGDVYVDTSPNATATPNAILELDPSGAVRLLWKS